MAINLFVSFLILIRLLLFCFFLSFRFISMGRSGPLKSERSKLSNLHPIIWLERNNNLACGSCLLFTFSSGYYFSVCTAVVLCTLLEYTNALTHQQNYLDNLFSLLKLNKLLLVSCFIRYVEWINIQMLQLYNVRYWRYLESYGYRACDSNIVNLFAFYEKSNMVANGIEIGQYFTKYNTSRHRNTIFSYSFPRNHILLQYFTTFFCRILFFLIFEKYFSTNIFDS